MKKKLEVENFSRILADNIRQDFYAAMTLTNIAAGLYEAAHIIRGHRSIENGSHRFPDVYFGEDGCRARTNHAAENLNVMRKAAPHLLRKTAVAENDSVSGGKCSALTSATISFTTHCSTKLNDGALLSGAVLIPEKKI